MTREEALERLKFLYDQVHQRAERQEHLQARLPLDIEPQSLNYDEDLERFRGEYNRLVQAARAAGILSAADLEQRGLPDRMES
ncbi:hypothetical protein [Symbiobacterium terraclitae]|uniref:hypothetical protein n=1 Tax=Symbiobacterium terraclitae TaxID=557451 RepID=UPI0035B56A41